MNLGSLPSLIDLSIVSSVRLLLSTSVLSVLIVFASSCDLAKSVLSVNGFSISGALVSAWTIN